MTDDIIESETNNESEIHPDSLFKQALKLKIDYLLEQILCIDSLIIEVQGDYLKKLEELKSNRHTYEQNLMKLHSYKFARKEVEKQQDPRNNYCKTRCSMYWLR